MYRTPLICEVARRRGSAIVDMNVILEVHQIGSWCVLTGGYFIETPEDCVTETQTGFQGRRPEQRIDARELRASIATVHNVEVRERAELSLRIPGIALDRGEPSLWGHALHRRDVWVSCGPDKASLRCGFRLGYREQFISVEQHLNDAGYRPRTALRLPYMRKWLEKSLGDPILLG